MKSIRCYDVLLLRRRAVGGRVTFFRFQKGCNNFPLSSEIAEVVQQDHRVDPDESDAPGNLCPTTEERAYHTADQHPEGGEDERCKPDARSDHPNVDPNEGKADADRGSIEACPDDGWDQSRQTRSSERRVGLLDSNRIDDHLPAGDHRQWNRQPNDRPAE